ncbi:MAG TPA: TIGR03857 family LLM class F420-dependent oxidoreductase [Acidimicrobiales bacterium]|jgi:probable F420-dependent oxidoreductase|nr:TIGR03857 family LLM class F420-dependent oxidoreductase [Acidimicrobiales bacterium]
MTSDVTAAGPEPLNELAFYVLAGAPESPAELLDEVPAGEALGLGSAFISERFNIKEALTLSGAVGAASHRLGIATAATNHNTRHPLVTASMATTMHRLTGGRFTLGLGRGIAPLFDAYGLPPITTAQVEDFVGILRRLFQGELVLGHDGPAGKYPVLHLDASFDEDIPIGFVAFGPNSLSLAGRCMDMVVLHTFFTDETTARCVQTVRDAAEAAGRDPASVRIWSCYAVVHDGLPYDLRLKKTVGRMATYLQGYGDLLVSTNHWDPAVLERFRADDVVRSVPGAIDAKGDTAALEHIGSILPEEWLEPSATGSPERCAERVLRQFDLGVDGVILHGASPDQLAPVVAAYREIRPAGRFDGLEANPGRTSVATART